MFSVRCYVCAFNELRKATKLNLNFGKDMKRKNCVYIVTSILSILSYLFFFFRSFGRNGICVLPHPFQIVRWINGPSNQTNKPRLPHSYARKENIVLLLNAQNIKNEFYIHVLYKLEKDSCEK